MRNILLAAVAATSLLGCVGGIDMPTSPPEQGVGGGAGSGSSAQAARTAFETDVFPIIQTKCAACHTSGSPAGNVTGFVGASVSDAYTTAVGYQALVGDWTPADAPILTKISGGHNATYTPDEITKITNWLNLEVTARSSAGGTGTGSGTTGPESAAAATTRIINQWSGCMTLTNFSTANMKAWGNMKANNSACKTCHIAGEYGQIAMDVDDPFFTYLSTNKYLMSQYFSVDLSGGVPAAKMIINTRSFTGVGQALPPHTEHPTFTLAGSTGMAALQKFYDLTQANLTAGTCGPTAITD
jgi:hypothetical protein